MNRSILLGIVAIAILVIGPYSSFFNQSSVVLSKETPRIKGIFDEIAEAAEKVGDVDERAEDVRRAGEEFMDDIREE